MPDSTTFGLFLAAATLLAVTPGPGIMYVLTRSLAGGRTQGVASSFGTAVGGLTHVIAAAWGLSTILAASSVAFGIVKYAGAAYLIYLGIRALATGDEMGLHLNGLQGTNQHAFRQGIVTEVLNPKTALFFLAFIPQFVTPGGNVVAQFLLLGCISVTMNTTVDIAIALLAGPLGQWLKTHAQFRRGQQLFTGWALIGLGAYVAVADTEG